MAKKRPAAIVGQLLPVGALLLLLCGGCDAFPAQRGKRAPAAGKPPSPHWVRVRVEWPGASPQEMERQVVAALEFALEPVPGIEEVVSVSRQHEALVWARFPARVARQHARAKVAGAVAELGRLPADMADAEVAGVATGPILLVALHRQHGAAGVEPALQLQSAGSKLAARLERNEHVAEVLVLGERRLRLEISLDPQKLAARGLTVGDVAQAVEEEFTDVPQVKGDAPGRDIIVRSVAGDVSEEQLSRLVLAVRDGAPVRIRDVGEVRLRVAPVEPEWAEAARRPGEPAWPEDWVLLGVHVDAPQEADGCAAALAKSLATFEPPPGVRVVRDLGEQPALLQLAATAWADSTPPRGMLKHAASAERHSHLTLAEPMWACRVTGENLDVLQETAAAAEQLLGEHKQVKSSRVVGASTAPELSVVLDRERCATLGVSLQEVATALVPGDRLLATAKLRGKPVDIVVTPGDANQSVQRRIKALQVPSEAGGLVPLEQLCQVRMVEGPDAIWRVDQERFAEVQVVLSDDAVGIGEQLQQRLAPLRERLKQEHPEFRIEFTRRR